METETSAWNSLEVAKLIVSMATPILVAILGVHFARIVKRRETRAALVQQQIQLAQQIPLLIVDAGQATASVMQRKLQLDRLIEHETPEIIAAHKSLFLGKLATALENFTSYQQKLRAVVALTQTILGPEIATKLSKYGHYLSSLMQPDETQKQFRAKLTKAINKAEKEGIDPDVLTTEGMSIIQEFLEPLNKNVTKLCEEISTEVRRII